MSNFWNLNQVKSIAIILTLFSFGSCEKNIKGVCEQQTNTTSGKTYYYAYTSEPEQCNGMFGDEYYHSDESAKSLGYTVKGEDDVPWKEGDLYFISPLGAEYPGENGYFSEATAGNGSSSNSTLGNWERSDGGSYMKLSGNSIEVCNSSTGAYFTGSYSPSSNTATLTSGSTSLTFNIYLEDSDTIRVEQYVSGNYVSSQQYFRINNFPC